MAHRSVDEPLLAKVSGVVPAMSVSQPPGSLVICPVASCTLWMTVFGEPPVSNRKRFTWPPEDTSTSAEKPHSAVVKREVIMSSRMVIL